MPQDALVKTGAQWPGFLQARSKVAGMQSKLHRWAAADEGCRFDDLFNLVCDPAFLVIAWDRVASNKGARSAGVDGKTVASIEKSIGVNAFLEGLRSGLREQSFSPSPVREKMIPKANGKFRRLGIPTVEDRVVQAALKLVLEPIFEADFRPCSYGFRPKRRAHDAVAEIHFLAKHSYEWVLEADIEACLDACSHCSSVNCLCQNRPSGGAGISMRRPFVLPVRVRTALRSPRLTFCKTAWRETPSARLAW